MSAWVFLPRFKTASLPVLRFVSDVPVLRFVRGEPLPESRSSQRETTESVGESGSNRSRWRLRSAGDGSSGGGRNCCCTKRKILSQVC